MKRLDIKRYLPLIACFALLASAFFSPGCANTTQSPTGGQRDTIPPVIVKMNPKQGALNVPTKGARFTFEFNEYVTIKTATNIFLSPPLSKAPKSKVSGKGIVVWFEEELDSNTTYTLDLSNAIADNNEGNMFPGFTYVFSTGSKIDSLFVTGTVQDCNTLKPLKGMTVLMYKDHSDSAVFLKRPDAAAKTDDWGYFSIRNVEDTDYRLYAIKDENNNNKYDPETELIAFVDSLVRPSMKVVDSLPELQKLDMKDTLACLARKSEYELNLFREKPSKQLIVNTVRKDERSAYITFMAQMAHIDSLWVKGYSPSKIITQFNIQRDSLEIWVNDKAKVPDTLHLYVNYRKTDSLGRMVPHLEHVKLYEETAENKAKPKSKGLTHQDTICVFKLDVKPETVEQIGWDLTFNYPLVTEHFDSIKFITVNPKQKESLSTFHVVEDSLNIRHFRLVPDEPLLPGYEYSMKIPYRMFRDINGFYNDSTVAKVSLPSDDKASKIILNTSGVSNKYIVDLLNEKRSTVLRTYIIDKDTELEFPYLKPGSYCIRITEDKNRNTFVDSGDLLSHRQPEKVKFFKVKDEMLIKVLEAAEISYDVNLGELFK